MRKFNTLHLMFVCACAIAITPFAVAIGPGHDHGDSHAKDQRGEKPVNRTCPISGERISADSPTTTYRGYVIAFCCAGCEQPFVKWSAERKNRYVAAALGHEPPRRNADEKTQKTDDNKDADKQDNTWKGDPYTLGVCPVSGAELGSMGEPPIETIDGREVRFCCAGCIKPFKKNKKKKFAEIDKKLIERQLPYYPLETCVVAGAKLGSMGEPINRIYKNRLVRFCCEGCIGTFENNQAKFIAKLDNAVINKQKENYPLGSCPVAGAKLGSMGDPVDIVVANRLVRFCCASCKPTFMKEPARHLAKIDKAWKQQRKAHSDSGSETGEHSH